MRFVRSRDERNSNCWFVRFVPSFSFAAAPAEQSASQQQSAISAAAAQPLPPVRPPVGPSVLLTSARLGVEPRKEEFLCEASRAARLVQLAAKLAVLTFNGAPRLSSS